MTGVCLTGGNKPQAVPRDGLAIVLTERAFRELFGYVYAVDTEVSCLGVVRREGPVFVIERFLLVAQEGQSAHTEMDEEDMAALIEEMVTGGAADEASRLKCWAHSHPGLGLFWSGTDDATCRRLCSDWLGSLVVESEHRIRARVDCNDPLPLTVDNAPVFIRLEGHSDIADRCAEEAQRKVKRHVGLRGFLERKEALALGSEVQAYCEHCNSWHRPDRCPLQPDALDMDEDPGQLLFGADTEAWGELADRFHLF